MIRARARYTPSALDPALVELLIAVVKCAKQDARLGRGEARAWLAEMGAPMEARKRRKAATAAPRKGWPVWAQIALAYIADGWTGHGIMCKLRRGHSQLNQLAHRDPTFAAALTTACVRGAARRGRRAA